jgi:hypothetical protein
MRIRIRNTGKYYLFSQKVHIFKIQFRETAHRHVLSILEHVEVLGDEGGGVDLAHGGLRVVRLLPGLEKTRVKKKTSPVFFFVFFLSFFGFFFIHLPRRESF